MRCTVSVLLAMQGRGQVFGRISAAVCGRRPLMDGFAPVTDPEFKGLRHEACEFQPPTTYSP